MINYIYYIYIIYIYIYILIIKKQHILNVSTYFFFNNFPKYIYLQYLYLFIQLSYIQLYSYYIVNIIFLLVVMKSTCESIPEEQSNIVFTIFGLSKGELLF